MSVLNIWIEPDHALIGVDTQAADVSGKVGHVGKLVPLVHLGAVMAFRGAVIFGVSVFSGVNIAGAKFDELIDGMPLLLPGMLNETRRLVAATGAESLDRLDRQEIALVGWSDRAKRIVGRVWTQQDPRAGFVAAEISPYDIAVWDPSFKQLEDPRTPEAMVRLIQAQCRLLHRVEPELYAGGRAVIARVSKDQTRISIGELAAVN